MSRILLVEDSPTQAQFYKTLLEEAGHVVRHAAGAPEALQACSEFSPEIVLLDKYLGRLSGLDVCRRIKEEPMWRLTPVLILTSGEKRQEEIESLEAGADRFLMKDCTREELLAVVDHLLQAAPPAAAGREAPDLARRILAVDDSRTFLDRLSGELGENGFLATCATSGSEALNLLDEREFDVGIIDIVMPGMDGYEVCRRARAWAVRHQRQLGLLVLSGKEDKEVMIRSLEAGADDFVNKSVDMEVILARIKALARRISMIRQTEGIKRKIHVQELALREAEWKQRQAEERARYVQELERSNDELRRFAYAVSHDLKAPLRSITGFLGILTEDHGDRLDAESRRCIGRAVDGARRMQELIDDLLDYARVSTQAQSLEPVDSRRLLEAALNNLEESLRETGAIVTPEDLPTVTANPSQLTQLFQNLVDNAVKYRDGRPPRIRVSARREDGGWRFAVEDNGIGIAPEYFEKIFVIFQRLHSQKDYPGTGIGLAICKKIVERHGGRIWVESTSGGGSTFYFTLPGA